MYLKEKYCLSREKGYLVAIHVITGWKVPLGMALPFFSSYPLNFRQSWKLLLVSYWLKKVKALNIVFSHLYLSLNAVQNLLHSTGFFRSLNTPLLTYTFSTQYFLLCWGGLSEFISVIIFGELTELGQKWFWVTKKLEKKL